MTDVFISYKREDRKTAERVAQSLRDADLTVWMDLATPGSDRWRETIDEHLQLARCVVVLWSERSVGREGEFVRDEATRAKARGVLLPIRIDHVQEPLGFGELRSLDLVGWRGSPGNFRILNVVEAVHAQVRGEPRPVPRTPRPRRWLSRTLLATVVGLCAFAMDLGGVQKGACKAPGVHSVCALFGWGDVPTREEETLWNAREPDDCDDLRAYLVKYPEGAFASRAERRLAAARTEAVELWVRDDQELPFVTLAGPLSFASKAQAQDAARKRVPDDAAEACENYRNFDGMRLLATGIDFEISKWNCSSMADGVVCGLEGNATCPVEILDEVFQETCL